MSNFGMTPISILDKGPMGGFRGGLADSRSIRHSDSALEGESLSQQLQREDLEKRNLDKPVDAIKRAYDMAKLENERGDIESGEFNKARETERSIKMQELADKLDESQRRKVIQGAEDAVAVASVFSPDDNEQTAPAKWAVAAQIAEQRGIKGFPQQYSIEAWQKLQAQRQAAPSMIKILQEKDMAGFKNNLDINKDLIGRGAQHNYDIVKQDDQQAHAAEQNRLARNNNLAVASIRTANNDGKPLTKSQMEAAVFAKVNDFIVGKAGAEKPTALEIAQATKMAFGTQIEQAVDAAIQKDSKVTEKQAARKSLESLAALQTGKNKGLTQAKIEALDAEIQARKEQVAAEIENRLPGYSDFKKQIKEKTGMTIPPGITVKRIEGLPGGPVSDAPPAVAKPVAEEKPIPSGKTFKRFVTNPKTGKRIREYTDGSWEYM
jgi:hypothetical protein